MIEASLKDLISINLRFSVGTESYRDMAYAQLATKALYVSSNESARVHDIAKDIAQVLGIEGVPLGALEGGLNYLLKKNIAKKEKNLWILSTNGHDHTSREIEAAANRISNVIKRHFPPRIEEQKLRKWFQSACVLFFGRYADRWVAATCKGTHLRSNIPNDLYDMLAPSFAQYDLESDINVLVTGFREFLISTHTEDLELLRCFGMAMYVSRLVAANVSADPVSIELIRNSMLLLDTNILIALQLEKHRLSSSLAALGKALAMLNVKPVYIHKTREEYNRALLAIRETTLRAVSNYSFNVIKEAKDAFTKTALSRLCLNVDDFERFFDSIISPPNDFGQPSNIRELDEIEISRVADNGEKDERLKDAVNAEWLLLRKLPKRKEALKHDAAIISVANHLRRSGTKCFVLTLDMALQNYGIQSTGTQEIPFLLSLDALLQILAVGLAGPMDPAEFTPLMASIISYQFEPAADTYTIEDLAWLLDIEERCASLPTDRVQELANKINRARLSGKDADDKDIRLEIQRAFQGQKMNLTEEIESSKLELHKLKEEIILERERRKIFETSLEKEYRDKLIRSATSHLIVESVITIAIGSLLSLLLFYLVKALFPNANLIQFVFYFLSIGSPVVAVFARIFSKSIPSYRKAKASAAKKALELIEIKYGQVSNK